MERSLTVCLVLGAIASAARAPLPLMQWTEEDISAMSAISADYYNRVSGEDAIYKLLGNDSEYSMDEESPYQQLQFMIKETSCEKSAGDMAEDCAFREDGVVKSCTASFFMDNGGEIAGVTCADVHLDHTRVKRAMRGRGSSSSGRSSAGTSHGRSSAGTSHGRSSADTSHGRSSTSRASHSSGIGRGVSRHGVSNRGVSRHGVSNHGISRRKHSGRGGKNRGSISPGVSNHGGVSRHVSGSYGASDDRDSSRGDGNRGVSRLESSNHGEKILYRPGYNSVLRNQTVRSKTKLNR